MLLPPPMVSITMARPCPPQCAISVSCYCNQLRTCSFWLFLYAGPLEMGLVSGPWFCGVQRASKCMRTPECPPSTAEVVYLDLYRIITCACLQVVLMVGLELGFLPALAGIASTLVSLSRDGISFVSWLHCTYFIHDTHPTFFGCMQLLIPLQAILVRPVAGIRRSTAQCTDERVRLASEVIQVGGEWRVQGGGTCSC
jgi:hypothetical protein